jgi:hypothetical protein
MLRFQKNIIIFWTLLACFSSWLMFKTFSFQAETHSMLVSSIVYSDFGSHIPLIRSFSWGSNFPPEYPVFAGPPIRYHYLFFLLAGMLEKAGLRIDLALNLPSIAGFMGLMLMIYLLGKDGYRDRRVGALAVIFFLFNSSLVFLDFFKSHPFNWQTPMEIIRNRDFVSFGPWNGSDISAFWNLNIYINQRHLAPAFALLLLFIYHVWFAEKKRLWQAPLWGLLIGLSPAYHLPSALLFGFALAVSFLFRRERLYLAMIGATAVVVMLLVNHHLIPFLGQHTADQGYRPGYLMKRPVTLFSAFVYWFKNLGLHLLLVPVGLFLSPGRMRLIWLTGLAAFAAALLFQFSVEMAANHKLLNLFLILSLPVSARALIALWDAAGRASCVPAFTARAASACIFLLLIQGGIFDFFPIYNADHAVVPNPVEEKTVEWIRKNTEPEARVMNNHFFFHPASIAGRRIFLGWPYFAWSAGYNAGARMKLLHSLYRSGDFGKFCGVMKEYNLGYAVFREIHGDADIPEFDLGAYTKQLTPDFLDPEAKLAVYSRKRICSFVEK